MDTEPSTGKMMGYNYCRNIWLLGIFKEYIKQNIIMAVLRKTNLHSLVICRLIKNVNNVRKGPRKKLI